ncbi:MULTISPECIES: 2Fe-2S iron-sulfur cluster-binding protein [Sphingomonadales]|jgi:2Fe-2S ferredoxin|uniref:2Fe-2S iron-sulfur cluster binding domain-containing protein n=2 Tax=Sphingomonadaceae TaxID=41297 RepID=A0A9X7UMR6_SPHYA|nr:MULTISPECIES: 2Fe-2S iron-sulfur cluster-binding protein [Sphingomonadaceae]ANW48122.1 ferredoxin [uncultured bacterium]ANW48123.1 ferredoxin [uncultured bacterium]ANW48124.1 ferredoxin [uncultured bacterium]ANW48125.1 ferredoxin [uncultured bacterium]PJG45057.1 ferredoxin [Sphingobium sp. LB126]|tara:strand:+ start:336 stop:653 length:318 start_codon:yes stop_codon:yes gene_type:complete
MPHIQVTTRDGEIRELDVAASGFLMEALRDANIDGVEAMCGGCCSCATCHVYIDAAPAGTLPPVSSDEEMLLSGLVSTPGRSRLSCQIPVTAELDGLKLTIPPDS